MQFAIRSMAKDVGLIFEACAIGLETFDARQTGMQVITQRK